MVERGGDERTLEGICGRDGWRMGRDDGGLRKGEWGDCAGMVGDWGVIGE